MLRSLAGIAKAFVALSAVALLPAAASANGSSVSPTRLLLATGASSTYVTITNTSPISQRYSASAYRWSETPTTPVVLAPTGDVVFFPGSFTLESLHSQRIRIGSTAASDITEKTYRIVVSELPPLASVLLRDSSGLAFTASFSIPIYLAPQKPVATGEITNVVVDRHDLRFSVRNTGNVHLVAKAMRIVASGASGTVMSVQNSAWFVLANSQHDFVMPLPSGTCSTITSVSIVVDAGKAKFDRTVTPDHVCG
jgi:P pilus assembly chaperone PapD